VTDDGRPFQALDPAQSWGIVGMLVAKDSSKVMVYLLSQ